MIYRTVYEFNFLNILNIKIFLQQVLCARGYSDQLSGMSNSLILLVGTLASFPFGVLAYKGFLYSFLSVKRWLI